MECYEKQEKIGQGAYGTVYKALHRPSNRIVALKRVSLGDDNEGVPATALREISLLRRLTHPCVVALFDIHCVGSNQLYMACEYMDQDLKKQLDKLFSSGARLPHSLVQSYLFQLLAGTAFCHAHSTLHRDLKPQNLLIDRHGNLKLADFGLARVFSMLRKSYTHEVVTLWYRPPEILLGSDDYSTAVDMWSIGCIFAEMASCRPLFPGDSEIDQLFRIFRVLGTPTEAMWPEVTQMRDYGDFFPQWEPRPNGLAAGVPALRPSGCDLLERLLVYNPTCRLTAHDALDHPYFNGLDGSHLQLTMW